jgi:hypothetical protein
MSLPDIDPEALSGNKVVRTFRMPRELVNLLGREAHLRGLDLTAFVLRILHGFLTYFSLPEAAIAQLEADREAMKMDRHQYLSHLLYHRCLALRELGPGFDDPHAPPRSLDPSDPSLGETQAPTMGDPAKRHSPLGSLGGGAHGAKEGLVPGGGVWPYGVKENRPKR